MSKIMNSRYLEIQDPRFQDLEKKSKDTNQRFWKCWHIICADSNVEPTVSDVNQPPAREPPCAL